MSELCPEGCGLPYGVDASERQCWDPGTGSCLVRQVALLRQKLAEANAAQLAFVAQNTKLIQRNLELGDTENGPLVRADRAEQKLAASERENALLRKGYKARGLILAAYRTGGRPSAKALDDAAEVAGLLDKAGG
jgi:hypothetical protein